MAVIQDADASELMRKLSQHGFDATKLASTGGFLREGNTTLMIGVDDDQLPMLQELISGVCHTRTRLLPVGVGESPVGNEPIEVKVGGAVLFVLGVQEFIKI